MKKPDVKRECLSTEQLKARETALLHWFSEAGLNPGEVHVLPADLEARIKLLMLLLKWVTAWRSCQCRKKMKAMGLEYPPVDSDLGSEENWLRFERWFKGIPPEAGVSREQKGSEHEGMERSVFSGEVSVLVGG